MHRSDNLNTTFSHHTEGKFNENNVRLAINYFENESCNIILVIPYERKLPRSLDSFIRYHEIVRAPKNMNQRKSFDDIFMIKLAAERDGIIVSNDQFQDLWEEASQNLYMDWKHVIRFRILPYMILGDYFLQD